MNYIKRGSGNPLLLIHGLGGSWRSWNTILDDLAKEREVIAIDLPGFGDTAALTGEVSIKTLSDSVTTFLKENNLLGIDAVGSSMGARLVLELARRGGILGNVVSLDPGGFWKGWERHVFYSSIAVSIRLVRLLQPYMEKITHNKIGKSLLLAQFSAHPSKLPSQVTLDEMRSYAASTSFDELLYNLVYGEEQKGLPSNPLNKTIIIGWGRKDKVCFPSQAKRTLNLFPDAKLHWFPDCGHFPMWDSPQETTRLILDSTKT